MYLQSPCERDSGVSVFGLAGSPPSFGLCLPHFLVLCPRSCFSLALFVLADTQWHLAATHGARMSARRRTRMTDTRAHRALFVLAVTRCHLPEPLNASDQPNTPPCLHLPSVDTPPPQVCTGLTKLNLWVSPPPPPHTHTLFFTFTITPAVLDIVQS